MGDQRAEPGIESDFLAQIPIFGGLPEEALARIVDVTRMVRVAAGADETRLTHEAKLALQRLERAKK